LGGRKGIRRKAKGIGRKERRKAKGKRKGEEGEGHK